jgi:hypothetical protein
MIRLEPTAVHSGLRARPGGLLVPTISSTSCDQAIFVDQATNASLIGEYRLVA